MKLVDTKTGREIRIGDVVKTFRGEDAKVLGWSEPRHSASTGRVDVFLIDAGYRQEFFPGVINARIVDNVGE